MKDHRNTIADVAKAAGVSVATVSRALGGKYPVAKQTREKIMQAVKELDYVANSNARALASGRQPVVAFILDSVQGAGFAAAAHGVEQEATRLGRLSIICSTDGDPEREWASLQLMREQRAEAVIAIGGIFRSNSYLERMRGYAKALHEAGSQLVLCGRPGIGEDVPVKVIDIDNEGGAYAMTMHLLSRGHSRILVLAGPEGHSTAEARLTGHRRALADFGEQPDPHLEEHGPFSRKFGYECMARRLQTEPDYTAVLCQADVVAAGAMTAVKEKGLRIPDDLSVVGFDDIELARDLSPELTSVQVPYEHLGRLAVREALGAGSGEQRVTLGTNVIIRNSVSQYRPEPVRSQN